MDVARYLVEAHLHEGRRVAELARVHGVHRSWLYKLLGRYRAQGESGLAPRSRRPHRSPTALLPEVTQEIVRLRADLLAQGLDAGALTIQWHLERRLGRTPSVSSIVRVLRRRGLVVPQPHKRPRSSFIRFEAALPNQLWQADATHWALADGIAGRDPQRRRRPQPRPAGQRALRHGEGGRCGGGLPRRGRAGRLSGGAAQRQRRCLQWRLTQRQGAARERAGATGHRLQARRAVPPANLRQGRALPSDAEALAGETAPRGHARGARGTAGPLPRAL